MHSQPPVIIEPCDSAWPKRFESERLLLAPVLAPWLVGPIEHVGSTAVPGLAAKPIIDIMAAVQDLPSSLAAIEALKPLRYCCSIARTTCTWYRLIVRFGATDWHSAIA
jgi:GrpB-like predicted nucleotidyltransferase (UPF0157 family)